MHSIIQNRIYPLRYIIQLVSKSIVSRSRSLCSGGSFLHLLSPALLNFYALSEYFILCLQQFLFPWVSAGCNFSSRWCHLDLLPTVRTTHELPHEPKRKEESRNREHKKSRRRRGGSVLKTNHDVPQRFTLPLYVPLSITLVLDETESLSLSSETTQHGSTQHDSGPAGFWQNNRHVACVCE